MWKPPSYLLIKSTVLPKIFLKVAYAKYLIESGKTDSITAAAKEAGISRSAIYKYKDAVHIYKNNSAEKIASIQLILIDKPGILSKVIGVLYEKGSNILTIHQDIPINGVAAVSISASVDVGTNDMELLDSIKAVEGVLEARRLVEN